MVYVHLANGFEEIEALTVVDILRRGGIDVQTVSVDKECTVEGAHGIKVEADLMFDEADYDTCEMIVLPGGLPGATNLRDHAGLTAKIRDFATEGKWIAAICASPAVVLGTHGLVKGKKATVYPGMESGMIGATPVDAGAVRDGNIITGMGPAYATEFALCILENLTDKENADQVAAGFLYQR